MTRPLIVGTADTADNNISFAPSKPSSVLARNTLLLILLSAIGRRPQATGKTGASYTRQVRLRVSSSGHRPDPSDVDILPPTSGQIRAWQRGPSHELCAPSLRRWGIFRKMIHKSPECCPDEGFDIVQRVL